MGFITIQRHIDPMLEAYNEEDLRHLLFAELIQICQDKGLPTNGTKDDLIDRLLLWKQNTLPIPAPSSPRLFTARQPESTSDLTSADFSRFFLEDSPGLSIKYSDLKVGRKLGSGGFKDCYAGIYNGEHVAIGKLKQMKLNQVDLEEVKNEISVLKQLRHDNIVQFVGVCGHPENICIVTELCEKGDLYELIRHSSQPRFPQQVSYMYDIAHGVAYLHMRRPSITHRDLKSLNILITKDDKAKVNDFGLARIRPKNSSLMHTYCGTINWQAPEFWTENPCYTEKVDVYSCGLIFWEILTWGEAGYPYEGLSDFQIRKSVCFENKRPTLKKYYDRYPLDLLILISQMWDIDPQKRPSMSRVIDKLSPYLN